MIAAAGFDEVLRFRELIARRLGLRFEDAKLGFLEEVLQRRIGDLACATYLARLAADALPGELVRLAQELTVPETYFFRNIEQFHAFTEVVLPERLRARATGKCLRILSAGCASGEEPYTLAILMRETLADPSWQVSIRGADLNQAMLDKAARARYTEWALRATPVEARQRWFQRSGSEMLLADQIRGAVQFSASNLADENAGIWQAGLYDVVFCRNVLMYFTPQQAQAVVARITRSLAPGGYLFLGHAETLRGVSQDYHLHHTHQTFYYQRREGHESGSVQPAAESADPAAWVAPLAAALEDAGSWVEAIRKASERITTLTQAPPTAAAAPRQSERSVELALNLLRNERYAEALVLVQALPPEAARGPDVLLLGAVLMTQGGQLSGAEEACRRLLELDELNAGAHYVLALCRESAGDLRGAADHDQVAAYLDPAFAMPRLHLGLLARRAGNHDAARRELDQALVLLEREDPSRLLLFGGGFNRAALLALGRAELHACGGRP